MTSTITRLERLDALLHSLTQAFPRRRSRDLNEYPDLMEILDALDATLSTAKARALEIRNREYEAYNFEASALSFSEAERIGTLNLHLHTVANRIRQAALDLTPRLQRRLTDSSDPMCDYEIDAKLYYVLKATDPEYSMDCDNLLAEASYPLHFDLPSGELLGLSLDWDFTAPNHPEPLRRLPQCWLFHELYDHLGVSLKNILRIGEVQIDLRVWHQFSFNLESGEWGGLDNAKP